MQRNSGSGAALERLQAAGTREASQGGLGKRQENGSQAAYCYPVGSHPYGVRFRYVKLKWVFNVCAVFGGAFCLDDLITTVENASLKLSIANAAYE